MIIFQFVGGGPLCGCPFCQCQSVCNFAGASTAMCNRCIIWSPGIATDRRWVGPLGSLHSLAAARRGVWTWISRVLMNIPLIHDVWWPLEVFRNHDLRFRLSDFLWVLSVFLAVVLQVILMPVTVAAAIVLVAAVSDAAVCLVALSTSPSKLGKIYFRSTTYAVVGEIYTESIAISRIFPVVSSCSRPGLCVWNHNIYYLSNQCSYLLKLSYSHFVSMFILPTDQTLRRCLSSAMMADPSNRQVVAR